MIKNLKLPKGRVSKSFKGRPDALKRMVPILKKKGFTGYLKIIRADEAGEGYLIMKDGTEVLSLYAAPDGMFRGKAAQPRIREVARDPGSMIEVHADLDMDAILDAFRTKSGRISRGFGNLRKKLEELRTITEEPETEEAPPARETIRDLADYLKEDKAEPKGRARGKKLRAKPKSKPPSKGKAKAEKPGKGKSAPKRIPPPPPGDTGGPVEDEAKPRSEAEPEIEATPPEGVDVPAPVAVEPEPPAAGERAQDGEGTEGGTRGPKTKPAKGARRKGAKGKEMFPDSGVLPRFTFDNFIVGDSNRFAHAACQAIAEGAVEPYNPLLLVGTPGLGKTHLLHAIGNRTLERNPEAHVRFVTATRLWSEIQAADRDNEIPELRYALRSIDLFLLDDLQDVEGRKRVQEELFEIFEEFRGQGKPLVMVVDRYPSGMQGVDARLRSRFESGLVVDIRAPDPDIRRAFVVFQLVRQEVGFSADLPDFLAERFTVGMRELEGGVRRVLAYAEVMKKPLEVATAREALGDHREETEPDENPTVNPLRLPDLRPGRCYIFEERKAEIAYNAFSQKVARIRGLLICRTNPRRIRNKHGVEGAEVYWLTDKQDSEERTVEPVLERILHRMESFMVSGGQGILMLEGLEFLKSSNSFEAVMKFLRRLVDEIAESEFILVLALNPSTWEERHLRTVEGEAEVVHVE